MSEAIKKLREERTGALAAAKAIVAKAKEENRGVTDEESTQIEEFTATASQRREDIAKAEEAEQKRLARLAALDTEAAKDDEPQAPLVRVDPNDGQPSRRSQPNIVGGEASSQWAGFGEYLFKVRDASLNPSNVDQRLSPEAAAPGMRVDIDSEGGYLIPDEFRNTLLQRVYDEGELLSRIQAAGTYFSLTGNTIKIPYVDETSRAAGSRWGGVRHYWVEEAGAITDSKPKFGQLELTVKKIACLGYVTEEMVEDYSASGQFLMNAFVSELTFGVEDTLINGTGAGQPLGVLNAACIIAITKETNQTSTTLWAANVVKMWARCWAPVRKRAIFLINQDVEPQLWGLTLEGRYGSASTAVDGIPLYHPAGSMLNSGSYGVLMGRPVIPVEYCGTLGAVGDIILFDPGSYLLVDKGGANIASSIHVRFTTDERTFRVTYRVDGQPSWPSKLTPFKGSNSLSTFLTVAAR